MAQNEKTPVQRFTTKFLAETLGYTQQSIRNAFEALGIEPNKSNKGYVLTAEQATSVARHFGKDIDFATFEQQETEPQDLLQNVIQTLQQQLEEKDKQIERLQNQLDTLLETNKAISASSAAKQVAETKELLIADKVEEPKKGFFARLFG